MQNKTYTESDLTFKPEWKPLVHKFKRGDFFETENHDYALSFKQALYNYGYRAKIVKICKKYRVMIRPILKVSMM